ncbi:DUF1294 domain-containing protein [Caproiciproducens sp.]|uniref:DUF1294 domain-containing protein n=1 Tax=Caproiciproducens sp. TaxID=1954376 RepID=UPI0028A0D3C7|nr:DUF1294 domain-containing protein [Caproiciproducens sp.]
MPSYIYWTGYLIIINFIAVIVTAMDKYNAKKHRRRVPENTLLLIAAIGGSPAMLLTMYAIHHKTLHKKFMLGIPIIITMQMLTVYYLFFRQ